MKLLSMILYFDISMVAKIEEFFWHQRDIVVSYFTDKICSRNVSDLV